MMSDSEFEKCQSLYESINELPDVKFLVGDPSVTDESTKAFDENLELKFDIDSLVQPLHPMRRQVPSMAYTCAYTPLWLQAKFDV
jgi:hypothetical protein